MAKLSLVLVVVAVLALAYHFGVFAQLAEPKRFAESVRAMGAWGYLAFVVAYAALQPFGLPGTAFIVAAPLIWPWQTAFALSMAGTMAASVVGFSFARFVARDFISARIPARFAKYDQALGQRALRTVFILRLLFWMPQALHAFLGVSKVPFWTHVWGSLLGYLPPLLLVSYLGSRMFDESGHMQPEAFPIMGGLAAVSLCVALLTRYLDRRPGRLVESSLPAAK